uniref:Uncharacterized protein n=1 Tax=Rhizophora mucronata TaxID=61149 RepID=A0A2P2N273_RHIMU
MMMMRLIGRELKSAIE